MFIGHYGVALAAKKVEPKLSLWWLFLATQFVDILWTSFVLTGVEKVAIEPGHTAASPLNFISYPYSHSLLMAVVWGVLVYGLARILPIFKSLGAKAALVLGAVTVSHWFVDVPVHIADLPLAFGESPMVGLGLWNNRIATVAAEGLLLLGGLWIYLSATKPDGKRGKFGMIVYCLLLLGVFTMTTFSGDAPPSTTVLAGSGLVMYFVFAGIAGWLDKRRVVV
jgi:hypothetical protein